MRDAYEELLSFLQEGEEVEGVVFGHFGGQPHKDSWGVPQPQPVPEDAKGVVLSIDQAEKFMHGWRFVHGFGGVDCYPCYVWTDRRTIWVYEYDGATFLTSMPRNPVDCLPKVNGDIL